MPTSRLRPRRIVTLVAGLALVVCAFIPSPYVLRQPGPALDTLGTISRGNDAPASVVDITGATTYPTSGSLYMLTVNVVGSPSSQPGWLQTLFAFFDPGETVLPLEAYFPPGQTTQQEQQQNQQQMTSSQQDAIDAALRHLHLDDAADKPHVSFAVDDVGGPSAGLMLTLAIIDKLTPGSLTGGQVVAGTGTISADGAVGPIGGVRQKAVTAAARGAQWLLLPTANCSDLANGGVPEGLTPIPVNTLDEALTALDQISATKTADGLPRCPAL